MTSYEYLEEMVTGFYDREVLAFSDFEWELKSGRKSPIYYNQRKITSFNSELEMNRLKQRRIRDLAVRAYAETVDVLPDFEHIFGIPQAMTALGGAVMQLSGESMLWGRVGEKSYGVSGAIEGDFVAGQSVVALDDVITTAASKLETAELLDSKGLRPTAFVVMFDREEGGAESLQDEGYDLVAITGLAQAMDILRSNGRIGSQETDWISQYHEDLKYDDPY